MDTLKELLIFVQKKQWEILSNDKTITSIFGRLLLPLLNQKYPLHNQEFLDNGQANSSNDYKYLANSILKVSPTDLSFEEFTQDWLEDFEQFHTSRGIKCFNHMVHLRALYNKAVKKKLVDFRKNPFKNPYTNPYA